MSQLTLFRDSNKDDEDAFKSAQKAKSKIQSYYEKEYKNLYSSNKKIDDDLPSLDISTTINQVRDNKLVEPDTIQLFIRKIKTSYLLKNSATGEENEGDLGYPFSEQIIPDWANMIYAENRLSMEYFLEICRQIFSLEYAVKLLSSDIVGKIIEKYSNKPLIIKFDHKIFSSINLISESINTDMALRRVNNAYSNLKSICNEHSWIILGCFEDFTQEDGLLKGLGEHRFFEKKKLERLFATDYILLNNAEFLSQKFNTFSWSDIIIPSDVIERKGKTLKNETFFYAKQTFDSKFYRFELYKKDIDIDSLLRISLKVQQSMEIQKKRIKK